MCVSMCVFVQGAECGEGLRRRDLSCVVHWGDWPESPPQPVDEELCGDKVRQQIQQEMEQPCFIPCLGKDTLKYTALTYLLFKCINIFLQYYRTDLISYSI